MKCQLRSGRRVPPRTAAGVRCCVPAEAVRSAQMAPRRAALPAHQASRRRDRAADSIACLSPSVGLSEPWRFVLVEDGARRAAIRQCFEDCNAEALAIQSPDRAALYARLKLAGLDDAPCQLAIFADRSTAQGAGLGRLTMPETLDYSVVMAIHTLWLAARAEGIGMGWVSILDPARIAAILTCRSIGSSSGISASASPSPPTTRRRWSARAGSIAMRPTAPCFTATTRPARLFGGLIRGWSRGTLSGRRGQGQGASAGRGRHAQNALHAGHGRAAGGRLARAHRWRGERVDLERLPGDRAVLRLQAGL